MFPGIHPDLPGTLPLLALKAACPGNPLVPGKPGGLINLLEGQEACGTRSLLGWPPQGRTLC